MSDQDQWEPIDYHDIRKGDVLLIITSASHDSPSKEATDALGDEWKPFLKVGATDQDTRLARLVRQPEPSVPWPGDPEE